MTYLSKSLPAAVLLAMVLAGCTKTTTATSSPKADPAPVDGAPAPKPPAAAASDGDDRLATSAGELRFVPVHHATLRLELGETVVWIDPVSDANLEGPKADLVLITDIHPDHYDPAGLAQVKKEGTVVVAPPVVAKEEAGAVALKNGESYDFGKFHVVAVPMYNLKRGPKPGTLYHPKGRGNGYLITVGGKRIYISGDTECTAEMKALQDIDVAFVCMNLPYTMPPAEAAACIEAFQPKVVYPYHYKGSDLGELQKALADDPEIEVRIRSWY